MVQCISFPGDCTYIYTDLEVLINGENIGRTTSCVGETVTYVCTVPSGRHIWRSSLFAETTVGMYFNGEINNNVVTSNGFSFRYKQMADYSFATSASVKSVSAHNGSAIMCIEGSGFLNWIQNTTVMIFGEYFNRVSKRTPH